MAANTEARTALVADNNGFFALALTALLPAGSGTPKVRAGISASL